MSEDGGPDGPGRSPSTTRCGCGTPNVHLLGHGYAPVLRYTDRYGVAQTKIVPFLPIDGCRPARASPSSRTSTSTRGPTSATPTLQVGFEGRYLPTVADRRQRRLGVPGRERNPALFLTAYRGDLGLDVGTPGSVYALDQGQIATRRAEEDQRRPPARAEGRRDAGPWTTARKLEFLGTRPFATLAIRYDPTQSLVLVGAVLGLLGLMLSLAGHRRRVWFRALPDPPAASGGGTLLTAGGLPRTDYPGFSDEFRAAR